MGKKSTESVAASSPTWETLEVFARQSMQQFLQRMLEEEVDGVLGRARYERRNGVDAVLPLATDEVRVDVRAPSRSAVFRYGQHVSAVERVFTRHNPLVLQVRETV